MRVTLQDGHLDLAARSGERRGGRLRLTDREWVLLSYLAERAGQAVAREELLTEVWGYHPSVVSRTIDATVARLRAKIEADPAEPSHLVTVYGFGYRLDAVVEGAEGSSDVPQPADPRTGTGMVGRDASLARLEELFESHSRVAVIGAPGVGKSRLVREWLTWFQHDEVRRVPLAGATTADDLKLAIAAAKGTGPWILDDVDLVTEPLAEWLGTLGPGQHVVMTCRQRTGVQGEVVLRLTGLDPQAGVALFLERAKRLGVPGIDGDGRAAVRAIVERLDGLPLAIEYAAARSLLLGPEELLQALEDGIDVLGGADRDDPRRGTMAQAIAWTWHRLAEWEQTAVSQLSVFVGGFTMAAASRVLDLPADAPMVIDVLQGLVDKCLCRRHPDRARWEVYTIFREFAQGRLTLHPHHRGALARHATWAISVARAALQAPTEKGRGLVAAELGNLRTAWDYLSATDKAAARPVGEALGLVLATEAPDAWARIERVLG